MFLLLSLSLIAQERLQQIEISGCVISNEAGEAVAEARIIVRKGFNGSLLAYYATGTDGCFKFNLNFQVTDSLVLLISHAFLEADTQHLRTANATKLSLGIIKLKPQKNLLKGVTVTSSPVWVRGDTTFFSTEHFIDGDEKKLRDLITKMPGFEIDDQGRLRYKKRLVEKFLIEGEPLFSEKTTLLLNSLPVHSIQTVQVLDNQNHNRLMKGLAGDNSIFLNIGLKKEKRNVSFGDAEAGIGSNGMFSLSPSWFLLGRKIKWGFAGNNNSTGEGFDWGEERDLRPQSVSEGSQGMMNEQLLHLVNNFPGRRYVRNKRFSNHLQANYTLSPFVKVSSQIEQLHDHQRQNPYYESHVLNDSNYFFRTEKRQLRQQPSHWRTTHKTEWMMADNKMMVTNVTGYLYRQNGQQQFRFEDISGDYSASNQLRSSISAWEVHNEYTHRISDTKAQKLFLQVGNGFARQQSTALSTSWFDLFELPDVTYNNLHQNFKQNVLSFTAGWELIRKAKRPVWQHAVYANWQKQKLANNVDFRNNENILPWQELSSKGNYITTQIVGRSGRSSQIRNTRMNFTTEYGWASNFLNEKNAKHYHNLIGELRINIQSPVVNRWSYSINSGYTQKPFEWYELTQMIYPGSPTGFYSNRMPGTTNKNLNFLGSMHFRLNRQITKTSSHISLSGMYRQQLQSPALLTSLNQVYQLSTDTLIKRPTHNYSINLTHDISRFREKFYITTQLGYYQWNRYILISSDIVTSKVEWIFGSVTLRKTWGGKFSLQLNARHNIHLSATNQVIKTGLVGQSHSTVMALKQQLFALKNHRFTLNTELYSSSTALNEKANTFFADLEWQYSVPKTRWSFQLLINNIADQKNYFMLRSSAERQDFFQLPLVRRYAFVSVRYEL